MADNTRRLWWLGAVAVLVVTGASVALAQDSELDGKIRAGDEVVVAAGETVDGDLYATAGQVRIEGIVDGDLLVAGGQVTVSGEVTGDVMASAGIVNISGEVSGDARIAVGQLTVSGSIGEDLFVAAGQATVSSSAEVGEDLVFGSGRLVMDGTVGGDVLGTTANYDRQGTVAGTESVTILEGAAPPTATDRVVDAVQRLISILLVAALFLWLVPRFIDEPAQTLRRRPLASMGLGVVGVVGFGVLVLLVILVTVLVSIGLALVGLGDLAGAIVFAALVALAVLAFVFFLATVFGAPAWVGSALGSVAVTPDTTGRRWGALILGVIVVVAVTSIPVVGGWLGALVVVFGLGAAIIALWPRRAVPPTVETAPPP